MERLQSIGFQAWIVIGSLPVVRPHFAQGIFRGWPRGGGALRAVGRFQSGTDKRHVADAHCVGRRDEESAL